MSKIGINSAIEAAITGFESLQTKFAELGAHDTEPNMHFRRVLRAAVTADSMPKLHERNPFELYSSREASVEANKLMLAQAQEVYRVITTQANPVDVKALVNWYGLD